MATVVGVDMEWYAPRAAGVSPDSTALLQICSDHDFCAIFFMKELGMKMSANLVAFLCNPNIQKVGHNLQGDKTKLHKEFPELGGSFGPCVEVTSLTQHPTQRQTLAALVKSTPGKVIDKDLGGGALSNWNDRPLDKNQISYAATDAFAVLALFEALSPAWRPLAEGSEVE
ncbi:unnamed protein product, partial [Laminaria digitata]